MEHDQSSDLDEPTPLPSGHEGSAPMTLTGRGVLGAWFLSVLLHAGGFGSMFLLVFPFSGDDHETEPPVANAQVIGEIDAVPAAPSLPPDWAPPPASRDPLDALLTPNPELTSEAMEELTKTALVEEPELSILGIGAGGGTAGDLSKYGLTAGAGAAEFFGLGGSAPGVRSIVYVVDRSGSMVDTFGHVRAELRRSITALRRSQKFHVIFFNAGVPLENTPCRLVNAIDAHRDQFFEFLERVNPSGGTKPQRALRRALALEPDLVYLLSDGINFDENLPAEIDEWNKDRRTRIFTIAYLDQGGRNLLERIAREHGGEFKFVSEYDLP